MGSCKSLSRASVYNFYVVWILFVYFFKAVYSVSCSGEKVGQSDPNNANVKSPDVTDTDATLLFVNQYNEIKCCGTVSQWEIYAEDAGTLVVQVWRPVPGQSNTFTNLGYNQATPRLAGVNYNRKRISDRFRIHVAPGDYLSVHSSGNPVLRYDTCEPDDPASLAYCAEKIYRTTAIGVVEAGFQHKFEVLQSAMLGTSLIRNYALTATVVAKSALSCTDRTFSMSDTLAVGDHVTTVETTNMDLYHEDSTFTIKATSPTLPVQINSKGEITVSGVLAPDYPSSVYTITVEAVDVCGGTATCTMTVTVENVAKPIDFTFLPAEQTIHRESTGPMDLRSFSLSRQRLVDDVTCSITSTTPTSDAFTLTQHNKTEYTISLKEAADLKPLEDDDVVVLLISCENSGGEHGQSTLTLHLKPDKPDKKLYWALVGAMALVGLIAFGCIIMACCVKSGLCKVWPSSKPSTSPPKLTKVDSLPAYTESKAPPYSESKVRPMNIYRNSPSMLNF